jgi:hypothetical protein
MFSVNPISTAGPWANIARPWGDGTTLGGRTGGNTGDPRQQLAVMVSTGKVRLARIGARSREQHSKPKELA